MKFAWAPALTLPNPARSLTQINFSSDVGAAAASSLAAGDFELQLQDDCESLKEIVAGLDRLEQQLSDAQAGVAARRRGYFTPNEDDLVRQMLLAYRSYRLGIYEIIYRYVDYDQIGDS